MRATFCSLLALLLSASAVSAAASFQGLGDFPGGSVYSEARDVSADGLTVVGYSATDTGGEGFRWTSGGGMQGLGYLINDDAYFASPAFGVSADGSTVVGLDEHATGFEAYRWTSGGGMQGLGDLPDGNYNSGSYAVSADGSIVVGRGASVNSGLEAFRWTSGGGMQALGDLPGGVYRSIAYAISADGSTVAGESRSSSGIEAFRWTSGGGMQGLGDLSGGSFNSIAYDISDDGSTIVGNAIDALGGTAFIWDSVNGMRKLRDVLIEHGLGASLTGWELDEAWGVSADGLTIVGYGRNPSGNVEAWIATVPPIPEPSSLSLAALAGVALLRRCRAGHIGRSLRFPRGSIRPKFSN